MTTPAHSGSVGSRGFRHPGAFCLIITAVYLAGILLLCPPVLSAPEAEAADLLSGRIGGAPSLWLPGAAVSFTAPVAGLYALAPGISWYPLCLLAVFAFSMWAVLRRLLRMTLASLSGHRLWLGLGAALLLFHGLFFRLIADLRLANTAAAAMAALLFYLVYQENVTENRADHVIRLLLVFLAWSVRPDIFWLGAPFAVLLLLAARNGDRGRFSVAKKGDREPSPVSFSFRGLLACMILRAVLSVGNQLAWSGTRGETRRAAAAAERLDNAGSLPSYSKNKQLYEELGISQPEYRLMGKRLWVLAEHTDAETLSRLAAAREPSGALLEPQLELPTVLICLLFLLLLANLRLWTLGKSASFVIICAAVALWLGEAVVLWRLGRSLARTSYAMDLFFGMGLLGLLLRGRPGRLLGLTAGEGMAASGNERVCRVLCGIFTVILAVLMSADGEAVRGAAVKTAQRNAVMAEAAAAEPDTLFLCTESCAEPLNLTRSDAGSNKVKIRGWIGLLPETRGRVYAETRDTVSALTAPNTLLMTSGGYNMAPVTNWLKHLNTDHKFSASVQKTLGEDKSKIDLIKIVPE